MITLCLLLSTKAACCQGNVLFVRILGIISLMKLQNYCLNTNISMGLLRCSSSSQGVSDLKLDLLWKHIATSRTNKIIACISISFLAESKCLYQVCRPLGAALATYSYCIMKTNSPITSKYAITGRKSYYMSLRRAFESH